MAKTIKRLVPYKIELIRWIDSASLPDQHWHSLNSHDHKAIYIESAGHLVYEDDEVLTLVMSMSEHEGVLSDITIPKVAVLERVNLA